MASSPSSARPAPTYFPPRPRTRIFGILALALARISSRGLRRRLAARLRISRSRRGLLGALPAPPACRAFRLRTYGFRRCLRRRRGGGRGIGHLRSWAFRAAGPRLLAVGFPLGGQRTARRRFLWCGRFGRGGAATSRAAACRLGLALLDAFCFRPDVCGLFLRHGLALFRRHRSELRRRIPGGAPGPLGQGSLAHRLLPPVLALTANVLRGMRRRGFTRFDRYGLAVKQRVNSMHRLRECNRPAALADVMVDEDLVPVGGVSRIRLDPTAHRLSERCRWRCAPCWSCSDDLATSWRTHARTSCDHADSRVPNSCCAPCPRASSART